ncbi:N-acetylmuramoyl-L-alanine amidase family protein [Polyangium jinanense]|uniref:N-acetylmuramoyl-L-alanine amidase n=1 Tax=Polyangium jinanense TaxID=2829994 RepID=A0A9X3X045_9BACT|nr:N-acetylmuramoyl-L-alanine amidase [Polyangium jinanense]MDC3953106.1 N-acetylmuramoyl-L-alanine amidase [Polyangium jinanense]MDC3979773.1 N-acetylmuramoyl-L-alanine amidase [Polyangium jinanense]
MNVSSKQQQQVAGANGVQKCAVVVVIDPGHGDTHDESSVVDPGAVGGGLQESDYVLEVSKLLKGKLAARTDVIEAVHLTREGIANDPSQEKLLWRQKVAVAKKADIFVSLHLNSNANTAALGKEVYYNQKASNKAESAKLAASLYAAYKLPLDPRGVKTMGLSVLATYKWKSKKLGIWRDSTIFQSVKAAALFELGFISNTGDRTAVLNNKDPIAEYLCEGICSYASANRAALCGP